ncbi:biopolymer transporter ExbD [Halieaceae bacterium IMCC14734]|uniref:Biopolymer transporter ExbD n=1 Tax=Candidatus Litorirhabdus singularis TaxID=2518993 RepID=A0ABT3TGH9_9GAMM|nr:biopolymer transporter ExbD [Candidatus Litorirhabdus singularis]MCX2981412.1 biopolymer transporter ExbD [Candidatus Litorirhabdus singularis]
MKFRRQQLEEVNVNLTPLIDVVFLLLIFFMVSTSFTKETHLTIDLPEAVGSPNPELPEHIEIMISEAGQYSINARSLADNDRNTLMAAIRQLSQGDTSLPMVITADAQTPHEAVVRAMDAAGQLGFIRLSITTITPRD